MTTYNNYRTELNIYVDIMDKSRQVYYYNYDLGLKQPVYEALKDEFDDLIWPSGPRSVAGLRAKGPNRSGVIVTKGHEELGGDVDLFNADNLRGIQAQISEEKATMILQVARYLCPVKTGRLRDSGHIVKNPDGSCLVRFDCGYAWYVHEFSWMTHQFPGTDHFLEKAVNFVNELYARNGW